MILTIELPHRKVKATVSETTLTEIANLVEEKIQSFAVAGKVRWVL